MVEKVTTKPLLHFLLRSTGIINRNLNLSVMDKLTGSLNDLLGHGSLETCRAISAKSWDKPGFCQPRLRIAAKDNDFFREAFLMFHFGISSMSFLINYHSWRIFS